MEPVVHSIDMKALGKLLLIGVLFVLAYIIRDVLLLLFISFILSSLINPFATYVEQRKIPRFFAVLVVYIVFFGALLLIGTKLVPIIVKDVPTMLSVTQTTAASLLDRPWVQSFLELGKGFELYEETSSATSVSLSSTALPDFFTTLRGVFGHMFSFVIILVLTFYLVVQEDPLKKIVQSFIPKEHLPKVTHYFQKIRDKLGAWMRGQLILSTIISVLVFLGLSILHVDHAPMLALLAGLMEFIPYIGPFFAATPAIFIALGSGGLVKMVLVIIMYVLIQQFENHLIVPKVMQKAVGINPVISILAIMIGARLAGALGVVLAIPTVAILFIFLEESYTNKS